MHATFARARVFLSLECISERERKAARKLNFQEKKNILCFLFALTNQLKNNESPYLTDQRKSYSSEYSSQYLIFVYSVTGVNITYSCPKTFFYENKPCVKKFLFRERIPTERRVVELESH